MFKLGLKLGKLLLSRILKRASFFKKVAFLFFVK